MIARSVLIILVLSLIGTPAWSDIGRIKMVAGEAYLERSGTRVDAKPGTTLLQGDVLVTGAGGRIAVTFVDNSRFSAGPNTRVSLDRFEFNSTTHEGAFESRLMSGSLAIVSGQIAKETPDAMKVRTPASILGVRGTRFIVETGR